MQHSQLWEWSHWMTSSKMFWLLKNSRIIYTQCADSKVWTVLNYTLLEWQLCELRTNKDLQRLRVYSHTHGSVRPHANILIVYHFSHLILARSHTNTKLIKLIPRRKINVCYPFHGNPSSSCWDISLQTANIKLTLALEVKSEDQHSH